MISCIAQSHTFRVKFAEMRSLVGKSRLASFIRLHYVLHGISCPSGCIEFG